MDRRSFIRTSIVGSVVGLAGCASDETNGNSGSGNGGTGEQVVNNDIDDDGVPDSEDDFPSDARWSEKAESTGTISVNEDAWYRWELSPSRTMGLSYDFLVRDGPSIDIILFSENEFRQYENQNRARYYNHGSHLNTNSAQIDTEISSGNYVLVVDNTTWGEATPPTDFSDSAARVEYTITRKV